MRVFFHFFYTDVINLRKLHYSRGVILRISLINLKIFINGYEFF